MGIGMLCLLAACKSKSDKLDSTERYVSAIALIQADIKAADSSLNTFYKLVKKPETTDSAGNTISGGWDSTVINRAELRKLAEPVTSLPDISKPDLMDHYVESDSYEDVLDKGMLTYTPKDSGEIVQRQTFLLSNSDDVNSKVNTILINSLQKEDGKAIEKNIMWQTGKSFQLRTVTTPANGPSKTEVLKVTWE